MLQILSLQDIQINSIQAKVIQVFIHNFLYDSTISIYRGQ